MLDPLKPALLFAPMDGVTDAPMRALQGETGAFSFAVSEFLRVNQTPIPEKVFHRTVPELLTHGVTSSGMSVQVQILGGHAGRMAESARNAWLAGAKSVDINFGCPSPTVNRNDGGSSLLRCPHRIREIVAAVRDALPPEVPVSAKLRLGWENVDDIHENAAMAAEGGATWLTIHARTRVQKYAPPVYWKLLGRVREDLNLPIVANGDIWNLDDFRRCREETGCIHFMLGRVALADPRVPHQIARELGLPSGPVESEVDWTSLLKRLVEYNHRFPDRPDKLKLHRLKQWLCMADRFGSFPHFQILKRCQTEQSFFSALDELTQQQKRNDLTEVR